MEENLWRREDFVKDFFRPDLRTDGKPRTQACKFSIVGIDSSTFTRNPISYKRDSDGVLQIGIPSILSQRVSNTYIFVLCLFSAVISGEMWIVRYKALRAQLQKIHHEKNFGNW